MERECLDCQQVGDWGTFMYAGEPKSYARCPYCRQRRRRRRHDPDDRLGHTLVEQAPDREAPERLRLELQQLRASGFEFSRAWAIAVMRVVSEVEDGGTWQQVFAATRLHWLRGFDRLGERDRLAQRAQSAGGRVSVRASAEG